MSSTEIPESPDPAQVPPENDENTRNDESAESNNIQESEGIIEVPDENDGGDLNAELAPTEENVDQAGENVESDVQENPQEVDTTNPEELIDNEESPQTDETKAAGDEEQVLEKTEEVAETDPVEEGEEKLVTEENAELSVSKQEEVEEKSDFTEYQEIDIIEAIEEGTEPPPIQMGEEAEYGVAFEDDLVEKTSLEEEQEKREALRRAESKSDEAMSRRKSAGDFEKSQEIFELDMEMTEIDREDQGEGEGEGEAEHEEVPVEEIPKIDREPYYERYDVLEKEMSQVQMKNTFLQKKMADYFKKRRMLHVFKESHFASDTQHKYELKLDALHELYEITRLETATLTEEIKDMKDRRDLKVEELTHLFEHFQKRENEIGKDMLLASSAGGVDLEKIVQRLMKRQRTQMASVIKMRLDYIMIRDKVAEKNAAVRALDNLGPNLHLMDYEQLKFDNRNHQDKLEERENDLIRLRYKCQNAMQMLAHKREKSAALDADMATMEERFEDISMEVNDCRERLNDMKQDRDMFRNQIETLKEQSGLLTKTKLLNDMEASMKEIEVLAENLKVLKADCEIAGEQVVAVRHHLRIAKDRKSPSVKARPKSAIQKKARKRLPCFAQQY